VVENRPAGSIVRIMDRYVIRQNVDRTFTVRVEDGSDWTRASPYFSSEAGAEAWIAEQGRGTEYTVSRDGEAE
jgi:hypothetical protein